MYRSIRLSKSKDIFPGSMINAKGGVDFRIWAPKRKKAEVVIFDDGVTKNPRAYQLNKDENGYFTGHIKDAKAGTLYKYKLDGNDLLIPDPVSLFQPEGPHGYSEIIDLDFDWTDESWNGISQHGNIIYEMHVGTFTQEGNWKSAAEQLKELNDLGITVIELMPVSEFPGKFGWGYDGVDFFAPYHFYGRPNELMDFINEAHKANIGVILDVVYNHFGPDGNYLREFSESYFSKLHTTDWGDALNYDQNESEHVRNFVKQNALFWIKYYHFDGLRLDATQDIFDDSDPHIISELQEFVRKEISNKKLFFVAENEPQHISLAQPISTGGCGLNALWNDDFHHSAMAALTGRNEAYYTDYKGNAQEFVSIAKHGFLFQGQLYKWQKKRRGMPAFGVDKSVFVLYIQNHDQIANSGSGSRIISLTDIGNFKALSAFMILIPGTPMLFMGQEFASSNPFYYFADHNEELSKFIINGRKEFLFQFRSLSTPEMNDCLTDPSRISSFINSKLDFTEREKNKHIYRLHKDLISLKKTDPVLNNSKTNIDGAVLNNTCFIIRYFGKNDDRLLLVNLGLDFNYNPAPEPLLSPLYKHGWETLFSTEHPDYHGCGTAPLESKENWIIPGHSAVLLKPSDNQELI